MRWSDESKIIYEEWDGDVTSQLQPNVDDCAWLYVGKRKLVCVYFRRVSDTEFWWMAGLK